jgi:type III restriction enzyme
LATQADGTLVADIVDPHLLHLADALPRLQGLVL